MIPKSGNRLSEKIMLKRKDIDFDRIGSRSRRRAMAGAPQGYAPNSDAARPWTFYALATLFGLFLLFLYGPMIVIYVLSFQGPNGGVTFPMVGTSLVWFENVFRPDLTANIPAALARSLALATVVSVLTVAIAVAAALGFRRRFPGAGILFYLAI